MRKVISSIYLFFFIITSVDAQLSIPPRTFLIGGSATAQYQKTNSFKVSTFQLSPRVGIAVLPNFIVQLSGVLGRTTYTNDILSTGEEKNTTSSMGIGPILRYYQGLDQRFALFGELGVQFNRSVFSINGSSTRDGRNFNQLFGGLGLAYFFNPSVSLELMASYRRFKNNTEDISSKSIGFNVGFQVLLPPKEVE